MGLASPYSPKHEVCKEQTAGSSKAVKKIRKTKAKAASAKGISRAERALIHRIRERTEEKNSNNFTRTKAYLDYFYEFREIHWSFLAHMVSRNAGWNMTDLKGELLSERLEKEARQNLFLGKLFFAMSYIFRTNDTWEPLRINRDPAFCF